MVIGLVVGLAIGLLFGVVCLLRSTHASGAARLAQVRLTDAQVTLAAQAEELRATSEAAAAAETARAVALAELDHVQRAQIEGAARAEDERARLTGTFAELSAQALAKNNEQFLVLASTKLDEVRTAARGDLSQRQQAIEELLHPLSESLTQYQRGLHQMEVARQGAYEGLSEKVAQLHQGHEQLQRETHNLVTALRSPQTRGRWGEMQLRRVAEMSGMVAHCDFDEQVTATSDDGRLRPDMVVHVPGGGEVVVDSKVPLDAFLEMLDADDDAARAACQTRHARIVRTHIDQLASKEYWKQFAPSPQMVVAFIPGDQLLAAAFDADPGIQEYAMSRGVLLTTPVTLIALLQTVALSWQQETLADNAREVQKLGAELYERLRTMSGHMQTLQRSLTSSVEAYNKVVGSLENRVLVSARRFPDLGVVGSGSAEIAELTPVDHTPRRLQSVELEDDEEYPEGTLLALPEGGAGTGTPA
ncbi:MAG TPA: DNA recombination protein RmuC [Acidimicrobiales bacterium]|nr:DNA recombination protein RmuC [Acidimicrobiales bacterium]